MDRWEALVARDPAAPVAEKGWARGGDAYFQAQDFDRAAIDGRLLTNITQHSFSAAGRDFDPDLDSAGDGGVDHDPHRLRVGQEGIVGYVTNHGAARIALDVGEDAVRFENPLLPKTRSELALPLVSRVRGRISVRPTGVTGVELPLLEDGTHIWRPFAPTAGIEVDLGPGWQWTGHGYFDANFGTRALEHLRNIAVELQMVPTRNAVHIGGGDFFAVHPLGANAEIETIEDHLAASVKATFDDVVWWANATKAARG